MNLYHAKFALFCQQAVHSLHCFDCLLTNYAQTILGPASELHLQHQIFTDLDTHKVTNNAYLAS